MHREEFYEVYDVYLNLEEHNRQLAEWSYAYNYIRLWTTLRPLSIIGNGKETKRSKCH